MSKECKISHYSSPDPQRPLPHQLHTQVKNISGRLMVGLRYWNETSETGGSSWMFESLGEGQRTINKKDSRIFWVVLYATPPLWVLLGIIAFLKLNIDYLLLVVMAVVLAGANLVGYWKCSRAQQEAMKGMTRNLFTSGLRAYFTGS
jgi:hypothetical protein